MFELFKNKIKNKEDLINVFVFIYEHSLAEIEEILIKYNNYKEEQLLEEINNYVINSEIDNLEYLWYSLVLYLHKLIVINYNNEFLKDTIDDLTKTVKYKDIKTILSEIDYLDTVFEKTGLITLYLRLVSLLYIQKEETDTNFYIELHQIKSFIKDYEHKIGDKIFEDFSVLPIDTLLKYFNKSDLISEYILTSIINLHDECEEDNILDKHFTKIIKSIFKKLDKDESNKIKLFLIDISKKVINNYSEKDNEPN